MGGLAPDLFRYKARSGVSMIGPLVYRSYIDHHLESQCVQCYDSLFNAQGLVSDTFGFFLLYDRLFCFPVDISYSWCFDIAIRPQSPTITNRCQTKIVKMHGFQYWGPIHANPQISKPRHFT